MGNTSYNLGLKVGSLIKGTKQIGMKGVNATKKAIHDKQKKVALNVIDDTKDKVFDNKRKMILKGAEEIVADKYAKGSTVRANKSPLLKYANFEDNWHINLVKLNPYKNQDGLLYKGGNKYAAIRTSDKGYQQVFEFKTLEQAENKFNKLVMESKKYSPISKEGKVEGNYAKGSAVKGAYSDTFKQIEDFGNEQYYIRKWGKVSTEKHDNMELLAVAKITDLEDYMPEDELPEEGNFQLSMSLVPIEKYIAKKHKESANDEGSSMGSNTIINVDNYMGGLNYDPQEKVFFKTFEGAEKYLLSKELNDKISAQGMMSGFILDNRYNRAGQTNWDYLAYMTGERERFAEGGTTMGFEYSIGGL